MSSYEKAGWPGYRDLGFWGILSNRKGAETLVRNFELNIWKETKPGVAQAFLTPQETILKHRQNDFSHATFMAKYNGVLPGTP